MQILRIRLGEGPKVQVPLIGVIGIEVEVRIRVLIGLFQHRVLEGIALAQRSVAVHIVVHPLVHRRSLFADCLQRRVRMQQRQPCRQSVVRHPIDAHSAVVMRNILHQPVDRVVRIVGLVGLLRVVGVVLLGHQKYAL
ncbi:MAG: hypothetical protein QOE55_5347 [Acidobacteriaceae bacterium]|nr:hypothetical protein [Acidobacteriaceae bacterium]